MRRMICFTLYVTMILVGIALLVALFERGGKGIIFMSGGFLALFGSYLLWTDFLAGNKEPS
jgi:hypothetical protein